MYPDQLCNLIVYCDMKFSLILAVALATTRTVKANQLGCVDPDNVDYTVDLFPHKVKNNWSANWNIEYFNTYKILKNTATGFSWLLYQCGTTLPASEVGNHQGTFKVPLQAGIATSSTTDLTHIEQLGLRRQLKGHVGGTQYIGSPCLKTMAEEGIIDDINGAYFSTGISRADFEAKHETDDGEQVAFIQDSGAESNTIHFSGSMEAESKDIYEWHKVFGALFNLEEFANEQFNESVDRYDCAADNADFLAEQRRDRRLAFENAMTTPVRKKSDVQRKLAAKPKILWASHTKYGYNETIGSYNLPAWDIGDCSTVNNYYCEFAAECQADILHSNTGSIAANGAGTSFHLNLTEFIEFAKDADMWIYPAPNFDATYDEFPELQQLKSVQNGQVYDNQKTSSTWFEHRVAEYGMLITL